MNTIKGLLIDPENKTVKEVEFTPELNSYYKLMDCDCITAYPYDDEHDFVLDDEALFKEQSRGFRKEGADLNHSFFGKALIVGRGEEDWDSHHLNIDEVKKNIEFFSVGNFENNTVIINEGKAE